MTQEAPVTSNDTKQKGWWDRTRESFQSMMPQWWRDNSTRINQLGLMFGTAVIIGSVFRGKKISQGIFKAQEDLLKEAGYEGAALTTKINELMTKKDPLFKTTIMKKPGLHTQRLFYLGTAVTGLGIGGFIKDKETKEERESRKPMSLPEYMAMRVGHAFDPLHHSRQTAGVVGATSGVLAIISAFSQPGGVLLSEAFVGGTLVAGFTGLTFVDDPDKAKQTLNTCWATRLPFVISGTYETLIPEPSFIHPLAEQLQSNPATIAAAEAAKTAGVKVPRWSLGLGPNRALAGFHTLKGEKAFTAVLKKSLMRTLGYKRMDISYPIGQWFNMTMAGIGIMMAGSDDKKKAQSPQVTVEKPAAPQDAAASPAKRSDRPATEVTDVRMDNRVIQPVARAVASA